MTVLTRLWGTLSHEALSTYGQCRALFSLFLVQSDASSPFLSPLFRFQNIKYFQISVDLSGVSVPCAAAAAKSLQLCPTLCDPIDGSLPSPPFLGFSRQEHWSGLPFPSPMHESESVSKVAQSHPTLCSPMDCSPPGSPIHGIFQARVLEWGAIALSKMKYQDWGNI